MSDIFFPKSSEISAIIKSGSMFIRPSFTPNQYSPDLWLDAADASSITLNGSDVSQWSDKSGNGNHFTQATPADQPAYTDQLNGRNVISFDGVSEFLERAPVSFTQPATIYLAVKEDTDTANPLFLAITNPSTLGWTFLHDGVGNALTLYAGAALNVLPYTADLNFNIYTLIINGVSSSIKRGNSVLASGDAGSLASQPDMHLGTNQSSSAFLDGKMAEFLIYGKILSGAEDIQVRSYFTSKWGL